jgi:hypothetical protein
LNQRNPNPTHPNKKEIPWWLMMIPSQPWNPGSKKGDKRKRSSMKGFKKRLICTKRLAQMVGREVWRKEVT